MDRYEQSDLRVSKHTQRYKDKAAETLKELESILAMLNGDQNNPGYYTKLDLLVKNKTFEDTVIIFTRISFAEYLEMYDDLMLSKDKASKYNLKIDNIISKHENKGTLKEFKQILREISAFMNTKHRLIFINKRVINICLT